MKELTYAQLQREVKGLQYRQEADLMHTMSYKQVGVLAEEWCDEAGISTTDTWYYPYASDEPMTVPQVMRRLLSEGRVTSLKGLRSAFDRFIEYRKKGV